MIGGMSWESSIEYYRIINEQISRRLGGYHSAKSVMVSVDFAEIEVMQRENRWEEATEMMVEAARQVERSGADFLVICTNTMHKMADEVERQISIPLLHIADATAEKIASCGLKKVGLLGTRFTMEEDFYKGRLISKYGMEVVVPSLQERIIVHNIIYRELVMGIINPTSRDSYTEVMEGLVSCGAEGVILGCTEIGLLVNQNNSQVPLFDTTSIHAEAAVVYALSTE